MPDIVVQTVLPHSPSVVWEELRHIERHVDWMSDAVRIDFRSDQREGVGTHFECRTRVGPFSTTDVMTVTRWEEGAAMGVVHHGLFTGRGEFTLSPDGEGTRLCWREALHFPWWFAGPVGAWFARPLLGLIWRRNLANFARQVRAGDTGRPERG